MMNKINWYKEDYEQELSYREYRRGFNQAINFTIDLVSRSVSHKDEVKNIIKELELERLLDD